MKRVSIFIIVLLLSASTLSGCLRSYSFFYDYDELMQNLVRAEIIYMEEKVYFFERHWYVDIEDTHYEIRKELTYDEIDRLIRALSNVRFRYTILWVPASVSNSFYMQGYGIKLYYESNDYASRPFIILGQTGDYRYGLWRLAQVRAGRRVTEEDWYALISEFYLTD